MEGISCVLIPLYSAVVYHCTPRHLDETVANKIAFEPECQCHGGLLFRAPKYTAHRHPTQCKITHCYDGPNVTHASTPSQRV